MVEKYPGYSLSLLALLLALMVYLSLRLDFPVLYFVFPYGPLLAQVWIIFFVFPLMVYLSLCFCLLFEEQYLSPLTWWGQSVSQSQFQILRYIWWKKPSAELTKYFFSLSKFWIFWILGALFYVSQLSTDICFGCIVFMPHWSQWSWLRRTLSSQLDYSWSLDYNIRSEET